MDFLVTNDVEEHSLTRYQYDRKIIERIRNQGLPDLLDMYSKYDVEGTFYFTGVVAEEMPEAIDLVLENGHEVGCHGYSHEVERSFDLLDYNEQVIDLLRARRAIEAVSGRIVSFRAPTVRINNTMVRALERTGFKTDSSIASQRFDGLFSYGLKRKLKWLYAPRSPYYMDPGNPFKRGNSSILEIPISSLVFSHTGTTMRIAPNLFQVLGNYLRAEATRNGIPLVFLFHPVEALETRKGAVIARRSNNYLYHLFCDVIKQRLKLKHLGKAALRLHEEVLQNARNNDAEFISVASYYKKHRGETSN